MKIELTATERAYLANLARRRAMESSHNAENTIEDRQKKEFADESTYAESLAIRLDDGESLVQERKSVPSIVTARRDIDAIDPQ
jgi:hypothetical protein